MSRLVLEETGLLPHSNPGVMRTNDLQRLRESNVSVGLMLESATMRLTRPGGAHWKAPDKVPSIRLRTLEEAGQLSMAFTTGMLIGIGETVEERVDALLAIRSLHERYRHIQEIIVQPFRTKEGTRMAQSPEPSTDDLQRTIAVARLLFGGEMNIQSPPNLLSEDYPELLKAGINDWGGISPVTKDFINPEAAWPQISSLRARSAGAGFLLRERLALYPEFSSRPEFIDSRVQPHLQMLRGDDGFARVEVNSMINPMDAEWRDMPWSEALEGAGPKVALALEKALAGVDLNLAEGLLLSTVEGDDVLALVKVADEIRRRVVGDCITYVVNRNLNFTNVCIVGCSFCGFARGPNSPEAYFHSNDSLIAKSVEAVKVGATEVCIQGGLPKDLDGHYYVELLRAIKARLPELHVHAFSPMEIAYGIEKTGMPLRDYLTMLKEAGLGTIPGTAAEILDDEVRLSLSPNKLKVKQWIEIIRTAHDLGIPTTSTMMYGHTELPEHWVRHILLLREIQKETRGFTEFVPLGFIHSQTRLFQSGHARAGRSVHEDLVVHALARVLLNNYISNIQVSWVKLGFDESLACLEAGANDFGGTLMEESISKAAGATFGEYVSPGEFRALIRKIGRTPAERTTTYKIRNVFVQPDAEEHLPKGTLPVFSNAATPTPVSAMSY